MNTKLHNLCGISMPFSGLETDGFSSFKYLGTQQEHSLLNSGSEGEPNANKDIAMHFLQNSDHPKNLTRIKKRKKNADPPKCNQDSLGMPLLLSMH